MWRAAGAPPPTDSARGRRALIRLSLPYCRASHETAIQSLQTTACLADAYSDEFANHDKGPKIMASATMSTTVDRTETTPLASRRAATLELLCLAPNASAAHLGCIPYDGQRLVHVQWSRPDALARRGSHAAAPGCARRILAAAPAIRPAASGEKAARA